MADNPLCAVLLLYARIFPCIFSIRHLRAAAHFLIRVHFLGEDRLLLTAKTLPERGGLLHGKFLQDMTPLFLHGFRDLVRHPVCGGSVPSRILKHVNFIEIHCFEEPQAFFEFLFSLSGKADDYIGRERRTVIIPAQALRRFQEFFRRIMPVHPLQDGITAALKGKVKMRADFRLRCDGCHKFLIHDAGFQRSEADTLNAGHLCDGVKKSLKIRISALRIVVGNSAEIRAVASDVDSGHNNFLYALRRQCAHLTEHILRLPAPDSAARIGNDAVGAELIAAVLNLDVRPGAAGHLQRHLLVDRMVRDIAECAAVQRFGAAGIFAVPGIFAVSGIFAGSEVPAAPGVFTFTEVVFQYLRKASFAAGANGKIDSRVLFHCLAAGLHITADGHNYRFGVLFLRAVKHLTALAVGNVRDRAGVYDIHIRFSVKRHNLPPFFL